MLALLQILALVLAALSLAPALAHVFELPGKMCLSEQNYLATQAIYYPGFTIIGAAEPLGIIVLVLVAILWEGSNTGFWLTIVALFGMLASHAIYWSVTHPVNNFWLKDVELKGAGKGFFGFALRALDSQDWKALRDRWEYSHVARAACMSVAFVCLATAVVGD